MMKFANRLRTALFVVALLGLTGSSARSDSILQQYEFQGQTGSETTLAPTFVASGLTGLNFTESPALTPSAVNGVTAGWLRAQLDLPLPPGQQDLVPESVAVGARVASVVMPAPPSAAR